MLEKIQYWLVNYYYYCYYNKQVHFEDYGQNKDIQTMSRASVCVVYDVDRQIVK